MQRGGEGTLVIRHHFFFNMDLIFRLKIKPWKTVCGLVLTGERATSRQAWRCSSHRPSWWLPRGLHSTLSPLWPQEREIAPPRWAQVPATRIVRCIHQELWGQTGCLSRVAPSLQCMYPGSPELWRTVLPASPKYQEELPEEEGRSDIWNACA